MSTKQCDICGGARIIRLPVRRQLSAALFNVDAPPAISIEQTSRTFACPQCSPTVEKDRIAIIEYHYQAVMGFEAEEGYRKYVVDKACHGIAHRLAEDGYIRMQQTDENDYQMTRSYRCTLGVVAPQVIADLDAQRHQAEERFAELVISIAEAEIANWGSHYGHTGLAKTSAYDLIDSALKKAIAQRPRMPDFAK